MKIKRIPWKILFVLYIIAVLYLCFGHFSNVHGIKWSYFGIPTDKIVHFLMFFPFPILFYLSFEWKTRNVWHSIILTAGIMILGYVIAAGSELGQGLTTYRSMDLKDFRADSLAVAACSVLVFFTDIFKKR